MEYTKEELRDIYDNARVNINIKNELNDIKEPLFLICKRIVFNEVELNNIIETLLLLQKEHMLYKVNEITLGIVNIICVEKQDEFINSDNIDYYNGILRNFLLPFSNNYCDYEHNLTSFLANFDMFFTLVINNCTEKDIAIIDEYNDVLSNVIRQYKRCMEEYTNSTLFKKSSTTAKIIMYYVLSHMATIFYLTINRYDFEYDILYNAFQNIINNYSGFLCQCIEENLKSHFETCGEDFNDIMSDYRFCERILEQTFNPPLKIRKYRKRR